MKRTNFQGDLTDISAKKEALGVTQPHHTSLQGGAVLFVAVLVYMHRCTSLYRTPIYREFYVSAILREPDTGFIVFYDVMYRNTCRNSIYRPVFGSGHSDIAKHTCILLSIGI